MVLLFLFLFYVEVFGEEVGGGGLVLVVLVVVGAEVDSLGGEFVDGCFVFGVVGHGVSFGLGNSFLLLMMSSGPTYAVWSLATSILSVLISRLV